MLSGVMSFLVIDREGAPWNCFSGGWNLHIEMLHRRLDIEKCLEFFVQ
jgi:hypothetical protein